jgi:hypothetical protein
MEGQRRQDEPGTESLAKLQHGAVPAGITFVALAGACGCAAQRAGWQPPEAREDRVAASSVRPADAMQAFKTLQRIQEAPVFKTLQRIQEAPWWANLWRIQEAMQQPATAGWRARFALTAEGLVLLAQERHRAAVAAAGARLFAELAVVAPAWSVQKLARDLAEVVPCVAEQLARERTPGWSTPAEDAEQIATRRDAYLEAWHALHEVQPQVRLGRKRLATKRTPASVLSLADQDAWVWQFVRSTLRRRYRSGHHHGHGGTPAPIEMPEAAPPVALLAPLAPEEQSLLLAECLHDVLNDLTPDQRRSHEEKIRAKLAG